MPKLVRDVWRAATSAAGDGAGWFRSKGSALRAARSRCATGTMQKCKQGWPVPALTVVFSGLPLWGKAVLSLPLAGDFPAPGALWWSRSSPGLCLLWAVGNFCMRSCPAQPCSQQAAAAPATSCAAQHQPSSARSDQQTAAGEPSQASARLSTFAQQCTKEVMHSLQNSVRNRRAKRHNIHGQSVGSEVCLSGSFSARTRKPSTTSSQPTRLIHV